jgi:hypothetical protein
LLTVTTFSVSGSTRLTARWRWQFLRVAVEGIDDLVPSQTHLVEECGDGLIRLGGRGLLALPPAHDPVLHGLGTASGGLGQVDHLLDLAVVVDVEQVQGSSVLDLLAIAARVGPGDVVGERAHVEGLALRAPPASTSEPS